MKKEKGNIYSRFGQTTGHHSNELLRLRATGEIITLTTWRIKYSAHMATKILRVWAICLASIDFNEHVNQEGAPFALQERV